jgi:hypothetical protein
VSTVIASSATLYGILTTFWIFCAATTLCAFHFLSAAACVKLSQVLGWTQSAHMPWRGEAPCNCQQLVVNVNQVSTCLKCPCWDGTYTQPYTAYIEPYPLRQLKLCCTASSFLSAVVLYFAVVADVSIASLNLSLLVNSVGFYQVSACACSS